MIPEGYRRLVACTIGLAGLCTLAVVAVASGDAALGVDAALRWTDATSQLQRVVEQPSQIWLSIVGFALVVMSVGTVVGSGIAHVVWGGRV